MGARSGLVLELQGCVVDLERREVCRGGSRVALSEYEYGLLVYLSERAGQSISRTALLEQIWGWRASSGTRTVDNTIMRLRAKIEVDPAEPDHVLTVRGVGYRYEGPAEQAAAPTLIGRDQSLTALLALLDRGGLITLVGPGGVGKTALATAALAQRPGLLCDLSAAQTPREAVATVADALLAEGPDPEQALLAALQATTLPLVVLDNVEQLADTCARMFQQWAQRAPAGTAILLTSRQRLRLPEEHCMVLGPLEIADGVALLRLRSGRPPVGAPSAAEAALVAAVDALPLAIELIAGWSDIASPEEVLSEGSGALAALTSRELRVPRHQSLTALMAHSWSLLSAEQAQALRGLSALVGSFSLADAAAVTGAPALQILGRLHDRSLLRRARGADGEVRFAMLSLIQADAVRRLAEHPDEQAVAWRRHAEHIAARGRKLLALAERDMSAFRHRAARDRGNLLAVFQRFCTAAPLLAAEVAQVLSRLAVITGDHADALARLQILLPVLPDVPLRRALSESEESWLLTLGRYAEAEQKMRARLPDAWARGISAGIYREGKLGLCLLSNGRHAEAIALLSGTLDRAAAIHDDISPHLRGIISGYLGLSHLSAGDIDHAEPCLRAAVALLHTVGQHSHADWFEQNVGVIDWMRCHHAEAEACFRRLLHSAQASGFSAQIIERSLFLGRVLLETGALDEAEPLLEAVAALARTSGHPIFLRELHLRLGDIGLARGDTDAARRHWMQSIDAARQDGTSLIVLTEARLACLRDDTAALEALIDSAEPLHRQEILALRAGHTPHHSDGFSRLAARVGYLIRRHRADSLPSAATS